MPNVTDTAREVAPVEAPNVAPKSPDLVLRGAHLTNAIRHSGSAKEIARVTGKSVRTAKRYRSGASLPDTIPLTRLMRWSRAIGDAVLRMAGLDDASLDEREARHTRQSHVDRKETLRLGGSPDVQPDALDGADEVRRIGRRG